MMGNKNTSKKPYEIVTKPSPMNMPKNMVGVAADIELCPNCKRPLKERFTQIPISMGQWAQITGQYCTPCSTLYVKDADVIGERLKDNPFTQGFRLNGRELCNYSDEQKRIENKQKLIEDPEGFIRSGQEQKKLSDYNSGVLKLLIQFEGCQPEISFIIVNDKEEADGITVVHYASEEGRELLAGAFHGDDGRENILHTKKYKVKKVFKSGDDNSLPENIITTKWKIRKGGGLYSSIISKNYEVIDTLVYSLKTHTYEKVQATLDKRTGTCYTDIHMYRDFVRDYGRPDAPLFLLDHNYGRVVRWGDLNEESIFKEYGYSVGSEADLSDQERRAILTEMIDLEIVTVADTVTHLDLFYSNGNPNYDDVRYKWDADRKYIQHYKVNPNRFLIADNTMI